MYVFFVFAAFAGGFAACWFAKDFILKTAVGAAAFADKLEAKAADLKAKMSGL